jgi:hypothetical protein
MTNANLLAKCAILPTLNRMFARNAFITITFLTILAIFVQCQVAIIAQVKKLAQIACLARTTLKMGSA